VAVAGWVLMLTPYYHDEAATLYHGDFRELAPSLGIVADLVMADPPYAETSLEWDRWPEGWVDVAATLAPQMWCFGSMRMFFDRLRDFDGWQFAQDTIWEKHNGSNMQNDRFRRMHELALHFYRGEWSRLHKEPQFTNDATARTVRRKHRPGHWGEIGEGAFASEDGGPRLMSSVIFARSCHGYATNETQKPEAIVSPLLQYSCPPGGLVVSAFAGSGTDLLVARKTGRRAIGFEMRESQCEDAALRLSQRDLIEAAA
jgi:site-specific DNA-methyltransferase (adenine-specific)